MQSEIIHFFMRKVILLLALLTVSNVLLYSQKEDIIPIKVIEIKKPNTKGNHIPAKIQVECCYYSYLNNLELSFMSNIGTVTVSLENQTTGEIQDYVGNSSSGRMLIPVGADFAYRMDIVTENGHNYYAVFFTSTENYE